METGVCLVPDRRSSDDRPTICRPFKGREKRSLQLTYPVPIKPESREEEGQEKKNEREEEEGEQEEGTEEDRLMVFLSWP